MPTSTYDLIASNVLSSSASSVTFSSIPATYRDLIVVVNFRANSGTADLYMRLNNDSGNNYSRVIMWGDGSSTGSSSATSQNSMTFFHSASTTVASFNIFQIMDYSATDKHKTVLTRSNKSDEIVHSSAQRWASTSAVNEVNLFGGTYAAGSSFYLYGIT